MKHEKDKRGGTVWVTWEQQRRSVELAREFGAELHILITKQPYLIRALVLIARTLKVLIQRRPAVVIAQNPSILLAALVCFCKAFFGYLVIVDRHSNFKFPTMKSRQIKFRIFHLLSRYSVRTADLTIVTNEHLRGVVDEWGGRGRVLQDKIPTMDRAQALELFGERTIVFTCSHSQDEPLAEVVAAARQTPDITIFVTGKKQKVSADILVNAPANIVFTDFLTENDYQSHLAACDAMMALTIQPYTLLCGAYEAVALGKPLILSDHDDLRRYFRNGTVFTPNTVKAISEAMRQAIERRDELADAMVCFRDELRADWRTRFEALVAEIDQMLQL